MSKCFQLPWMSLCQNSKFQSWQHWFYFVLSKLVSTYPLSYFGVWTPYQHQVWSLLDRNLICFKFEAVIFDYFSNIFCVEWGSLTEIVLFFNFECISSFNGITIFQMHLCFDWKKVDDTADFHQIISVSISANEVHL